MIHIISQVHFQLFRTRVCCWQAKDMLLSMRPVLEKSSSCFAFLRGIASGAEGMQARITPRWYKEVSVVPNAVEGEYLIQLDRRSLQTPARHLLAVPSHPLALAIAAEWQWQDAGRIRPFTMPLMSLAATAIDEPKPREKVIDTLLRYMHTDALTCRHDRATIADRQKQLYDPLLEWASNHFGTLFIASDSIFGAQQSEEAEAAMHKFLAGLSSWELTGVEHLGGTCKSLLLGIAIFKGRIGAREAISLARLEEEVQLEEWGYVEGGHDIDDADIRVRITSGSIFARLLTDRVREHHPSET